MRSYLFSQVTGLFEPLGVTNYAERRDIGELESVSTSQALPAQPDADDDGADG
ncbi:hypothetical protein [Streptomyces sp. NPDC055692]|uniref:hypothetical protein n=1 Tax=Streptomyces sp. NPDC055692 TaxID=3155683 RepID=UPI003447B8BB